MTSLAAGLTAFLGRCGSRHELRFVESLLRRAPLVATGGGSLVLEHGDRMFRLEAQAEHQDIERESAAPWRVDFLIRSGKCVLAVEIDDPSHWTDRAKAQEDRRKDQQLAIFGAIPLRFVNEDAEAAAAIVLAVLERHG